MLLDDPTERDDPHHTHDSVPKASQAVIIVAPHASPIFSRTFLALFTYSMQHSFRISRSLLETSSVSCAIRQPRQSELGRYTNVINSPFIRSNTLKCSAVQCNATPTPLLLRSASPTSYTSVLETT